LSKTLLISLFGEDSGQLLMVIRLVIFKDEGFMVFLIKLMFFSALTTMILMLSIGMVMMQFC
jgi:hypothetical protein